jgi:hypothetical protein
MTELIRIPGGARDLGLKTDRPSNQALNWGVSVVATGVTPVITRFSGWHNSLSVAAHGQGELTDMSPPDRSS